jgi:hypothetical protein
MLMKYYKKKNIKKSRKIKIKSKKSKKKQIKKNNINQKKINSQIQPFTCWSVRSEIICGIICDGQIPWHTLEIS